MNRRGFLRSSSLATAAFGALALRVSPQAEGEIAGNLATPEFTIFTAGQTACSILIANDLAGRSRPSDWEMMEANLGAIGRFWVSYKVDSVVAEPLSRLTVADLTPAAFNTRAILGQVQAFHPGAAFSELNHAAGFLDRIPTDLKQDTLSRLQQDGFSPHIQQARTSAGWIATEKRGFTVRTWQTNQLDGGTPLRQKATLCNASECITVAGMIFVTIAVLALPQGWHAVTDWGVSAAIAAGTAARSFAVNDTHLTESLDSRQA